MVSSDLKTTSNCKIAGAKDCRVLWVFRRSFQYLNEKMFGLFYPTFKQRVLVSSIRRIRWNEFNEEGIKW